MAAACSGFPGSSTLDARRITIEPDRSPPPFARHRGQQRDHVLRGNLRLEFDTRPTPSRRAGAPHFDAARPHRLGTEGTTTELLVVAVDAPPDPRNRPLFPSWTSHTSAAKKREDHDHAL